MSCPYPDPCEFNPEAGRPAWRDEPAHAAAEVVLRDPVFGTWRLCRACASLPRFRHCRKQSEIKP